MTAPALAGQHAVVTGGGRGIGLAIAAKLASLGASLSLVGRDRATLYDAVQSLPDGTVCDAHPCDVADAASVEATFAAIAKAGHRVSILVNNAGAAKSARLAATDDALWREAELWRKDGDQATMCDRLATLASDFPDSRYVPCAIERCPSIRRDAKSKAPKTCHAYLTREASPHDESSPSPTVDTVRPDDPK